MTTASQRTFRRFSLFIAAAPGLVGTTFLNTELALADVINDPLPPKNLPDSGYSAPLQTVAFSADGKSLISLDANGEIRSRDIKTAATQSILSGQGSDLKISAAGEYFTTGPNGAVIRWAKDHTGHLRKANEYVPPAPESDAEAGPGAKTVVSVVDYAVSPDGKTVAVCNLTMSNSGRGGPSRQVAQIRVWNADQTLRFALEPEIVPAARGLTKPGPSKLLAFADSGRTLLVGQSDVALKRYDATKGTLISEWKPPADGAPKPDPAAEAAETEHRLSTLPPAMQERARRQWNAAKRTVSPMTLGHSLGVCWRFRPMARSFWQAHALGFQLWNTADNSSKILEKSERMSQNDEAAFSGDGNVIAARLGGSLWLWKRDGSQVGSTRINFAKYTSFAFSPDHSQIALSDETGVARIWTTTAPLAPTSDITLGGYFEPWRQIRRGGTNVFGLTSKVVAILDATGKPNGSKKRRLNRLCLCPKLGKIKLAR